MDLASFAAIAGQALTVLGFALAPFMALPLLVLASGRFGAEIALPVTQIAEAASALAERIAQVLLALMTALVGLIVVLRYGFGVSSNLLGEASIYAHAFSFMLAAAAALGRDGHVRVDVIYARLSARGKAIVNLFGYAVFTAPMLVAILIFSGPYVARSWAMGERSAESDGLAGLFLLKTAIPVFAVLLLAQAIAEACRQAAILSGAPPAPKRFAPDEIAPG
jgi:TRAP-type mannitol/chloroaromatic compound transport system permease small subunit